MGLLPPAVELVVARCHEDLRWLGNLPASVRVKVFNKGAPLDRPCIALPNVGREAFSYLVHLTTNYDQLAEVALFAQGHPFDHVPGLHRYLRELASGLREVREFDWLGFLIDTEDPEGGRCFATWSKNPERRGLDLRGFYRELFEAECPEAVPFVGGANFAVPRVVAHRRPREFYARAMELSVRFPDAAHCFERVWDRVFLAPGIDPARLDAEGRAYLKPIRRLNSAASSATNAASAAAT